MSNTVRYDVEQAVFNTLFAAGISFDSASVVPAVTRAALASVASHPGLEEVLGLHCGYHLRERYPWDLWYVCDGCGAEIETERSLVGVEFIAHQREAIQVWLGGTLSERLSD